MIKKTVGRRSQRQKTQRFKIWEVGPVEADLGAGRISVSSRQLAQTFLAPGGLLVDVRCAQWLALSSSLGQASEVIVSQSR